jgi:hypothetical protein
MNEYPKVVTKKKNIQTLIDYCLIENIEFSVRNKPFSDNDLEVELKISDIKKALVTGMFLRENRIELDSMETTTQKVAVPKKASSKKSKGEESNGEASAEDMAKIEEEESGLFKG